MRAELWGGFVFINMDRHAEPLLEYLDPIPTVFAPFQFEHMRITWLKGGIVPCNWKTVLDGFLEAYHVPGTHPQLHRRDKTNHNIISLRELEQRIWAPTATYGKFARYASESQKRARIAGVRNVSAGHQGPALDDATDQQNALADAVQYMHWALRALHPAYELEAAEELRTADLPEGTTTRQYFNALRKQHALARGIEWRDITPEEFAAAGTAWNVFPNTVLLPNQGNIIGYRARPYGLDPDRCLYEAFCLEQIPVADYDKKWEFEPEFYEDWTTGDWGEILTQDLDNSEDVTIGMHSPSFDGHRVSGEQEMTIYNHHRAADHYLW